MLAQQVLGREVHGAVVQGLADVPAMAASPRVDRDGVGQHVAVAPLPRGEAGVEVVADDRDRPDRDRLADQVMQAPGRLRRVVVGQPNQAVCSA